MNLNIIPIKRITLAFVFGIISGYYFLEYKFIFICLFTILIIITQITQTRKLYILIIILVFLLGFLYIVNFELSYVSHNSINKYNGQTVEIIGKIKSDLKSLEGNDLFLNPLLINNIKVKNGLIKLSKDKINNKFKHGDLIIGRFSLTKPAKARNPGGFSYYNYLKKNKIYSLGKTLEIYKIQSDPNYINIILRLKKYLINSIDLKIKKPINNFIKALILGEKDNLALDWKSNFKRAGINHLLAISGLHIGFITLFLINILKPISLSNKSVNIILSIFLTIYIIMTGFRASVIRASLLVILFKITKYYKIDLNIIDALSIVLILILVLNPYQLFTIGLQLSFFVLISIITCTYILNKYLHPVLAVSIAAQLGSMPLTAYYFNTISPAGIITNLWAVPLVSIIVFLSLLHFVFYWVFPLMSNITGKFIELLAVILKEGTKIMSFLPSAEVNIITPSIFIVIIYYLILFGTIFLIKYKKNFLNKYTNYFKYIILSFIIIILFSFYILIPNIYSNKYLEITCLDVGQGDSIFVNTPDDINILVDTGGYCGNYTQAKRTIIPFLLKKGVYHLDFLIITHFDSDHSSGILTLVENNFIKNIIVSKNFCYYDQKVKKIIELLEEKNINVYVVNKNDKLKLNKININFLFPFDDKRYEDKNNNSVVFKLNYKEFEMLFTGDIEFKAEKEIINNIDHEILESDLIKVGHHGSITSSSAHFIKIVNPKESIISVGYNKFGHPSKEVIDRLKNNNVRVWRTDRNGAIIIKTDGIKYNITPYLID